MSEEKSQRQARKNPKLAAERLAESTGFDDNGNVVPTTDFDELSIELAQLRIDPAAFRAAKPKKKRAMLLAAGVSKKEAVEWLGGCQKRTPRQRHRQLEEWQKQKQHAEAWLRERGFSQRDRALVLGRVFHKASIRQLETATGWKKTRIAGKLKSPTIKRCIEELKSGRPLASPKPPELLPVSKFLDEARILREWQQVNNPLHRLMEWAARELDWQALSYLEVKRPARNVTRESFWDNEKVTGGLRMLREHPEKLKNLPRGIMNYIRAYPALLLLPEGKVLLRGLVDVLEEARFGTSRRRVRALMPEGSRKARAKAAQDALAWLARGNRGEKLHYRLDEIMMYLKLRVTQLQAEYKATENMPTTAMRREKLREDHREELEKFTDRELQNLVNDEPVKVAARVAEKATGLSQETFLRARREIEAELTEERERAKSFEHFFPQMGRVSR